MGLGGVGLERRGLGLARTVRAEPDVARADARPIRHRLRFAAGGGVESGLFRHPLFADGDRRDLRVPDVLDRDRRLPRAGRERAVERLRTPPRGQDADLPRLVRGETEGRTVRERDLAREEETAVSGGRFAEAGLAEPHRRVEVEDGRRGRFERIGVPHRQARQRKPVAGRRRRPCRQVRSVQAQSVRRVRAHAQMERSGGGGGEGDATAELDHRKSPLPDGQSAALDPPRLAPLQVRMFHRIEPDPSLQSLHGIKPVPLLQSRFRYRIDPSSSFQFHRLRCRLLH